MKFRINWDALGITASVACAIHCALLPLFLSSLPLFGVNIIHNLAFEAGMVLLAFCIGTYSFYHGYKKHHHSFMPFFFIQHRYYPADSETILYTL
ncbi:MAG: MerC domain-containing protein [Chitinophagaceae bacterium]